MPEQSTIQIDVQIDGLTEAQEKIEKLDRMVEAVVEKLDRAEHRRVRARHMACREADDLAEAQKELVAELKRQNDIAERVQGVEGREAMRSLADLISGQISKRAKRDDDGAAGQTVRL